MPSKLFANLIILPMIMGILLFSLSMSNKSVLSILLSLEIFSVFTIMVFISPQNHISMNMLSYFTLFTLAVGEACVGLGVYLKFFRMSMSSLLK